MFREKMGVRSVRLAIGLLSGLAMAQSYAQDQAMQRVEVTGSAIKRINVEGALPIQTLSQETIAKTGATNVAELVQALPAMQGFTVSAVAAGTNSGGRVSASIHGIGEEYTLVLLNGRRLAPTGSGSSVNLQSIPMSAVERVEILTDGASALYGSDAIAGVVNFVLKKNQQGGEIEANYNSPTDSSKGNSKYVAGSFGFGDLETDNFNVLVSYRHDDQSQMKATDRDFANTAYRPFRANGTNYIFDMTSSYATPANVNVSFADKRASIGFSPYLKQNGNCPAMNQVSLNNTATTQKCAFDYAQTVEIVPESKRDSLFLKGTLKVNDNFSLFSDVAYSRFDLTARIAATPIPFSIGTDSALYSQYVAPYLTADQAANVSKVSGTYRSYDWGTRASQTITESKHVVVGAEGNYAGWDINGALTWSENSTDERYVGGYIKSANLTSMLADGSVNPFALIGQQSDSTKSKIADSIYHGSVRDASTTLKAADIHGSREVFTLPGGPAQLAIGADYREYHYQQTPTADALNDVIYNYSADAEFDMKRENVGAFAELLMPITKKLEVSGALRYDTISKIDDAVQKRSFGKDQSKTTYKISARFQPTQKWLFRGSYGTGFKAASMEDIASPEVYGGYTSANYNCPIANATLCRPGKTQYDTLYSGNENLKPETSKQFTIGARWEPMASLSLGLDLWDVKIRDAVSSVSEQQAFADPVKFASLFGTYTEQSTGDTYWAFRQSSVNIGQTHNRGIDWDITTRQRFSFGKLTTTLNGTRMLNADYTVPGTADQWTSSMNYFGIDNNVTFKNIVRLSSTLDTGNMSNTVIANYRNGYTDQEAYVRNVDTGLNEDIRLHVPSFMTFDYQMRYKVTPAFTLRGGIKNVFDREPPLSLRSSSGHQVGFDPRYADPMGRTFYITGNYKF